MGEKFKIKIFILGTLKELKSMREVVIYKCLKVHNQNTNTAFILFVYMYFFARKTNKQKIKYKGIPEQLSCSFT